MGYGSHRPELTIELDTDSASYRANIFEGTLEKWQGGKLISIETDEATKIQMLRSQMKKFLGVPDYCSDKTPFSGLCSVDSALECLRICENALT